MDISVSQRDGHLVWELRGDLDFEGACAVRSASKACAKPSGLLVVDLRGVPFVDSAGLAALIGLSRRVSEGGGNLVVSGARRSVLRLLRITGVDRSLQIADSNDSDRQPFRERAVLSARNASRW